MIKLYFISGGRIVEFNPQNVQGIHIKSIIVWDKNSGFFEINLSIPHRERIDSMSAHELKQMLDFLESFCHSDYGYIDEGLQFALSELTPYKLEGTLDELAKGILLADGLPQNMVELVLNSIDKAELIKEEQKRFTNASNLEVLEDCRNNVVWVYQKAR